MKRSTFIFQLLLAVSFVVSVQAEVQPIKEVFSPQPPNNLQDFMKVAVVQSNPFGTAPVGASKEVISDYLSRNRQQMASEIQEAVQNGAGFIVLSEFSVIGYPDIPELPSEEDNYRNREDIKDFVETIPGASTEFFSKIAVENKVWIQIGLAEVDPKTDRYYNVAVVINDQGQVVASHRKKQLYLKENDFLSAGQGPTVFDSPIGKIGLVICADIYDYSLLNSYKSLGVDVLSLSTSWAQANTGMGFFKRAALHNKAYVLAANQTYFPDSGVINPDGSTQSHIRQSRHAIAYGYLPLVKKQVNQKRK